MNPRIKRTARVVLALSMAVGLVALSGCSGDNSTIAPQAPEYNPDSPHDSTPGDQSNPNADRKIARTASVSLSADDVSKVAQGLRDLAGSFGGLITMESVTLPDESGLGSSYASIQLSVPSAKLDEALAQIATLGKVTNSRIDAEDVTEQVVDVESRIKTMRQSITRLQELIDQSGSVADIAAVEAELTRRQADLESLLAVQKSLEFRVQSATIDVSVRNPSVGDSSSFLSALVAGWEAMVTTAKYLVIVIGALLPWLALAAVILVPILLVRRRRRAQGKIKPKKAAPAPMAWPPQPAPTNQPPTPKPDNTNKT